MTKQQFPEATVGALVLNPRKEMLLVQSHKWHNKFTIPGGHVELGESLEQALRRELKEETGLAIFDIRFVCWQEFIFDRAYWKPRHYIFFDFACRTHSTNVQLNSEGQRYRWALPRAALKLPIDP